ncbi:MAG: 2OG-Fe(II) oxygenase [Flavobacteriales bacterium]|nr:2OG-Fe(II) oxygenase [Flavobacteriales bacterium]MCB9167973.1 2OG-Fe(II) oxygenase [Flavobacteriales bacterium]
MSWTADQWVLHFDRLADQDFTVVDGAFPDGETERLLAFATSHVHADDLHDAGIGADGDFQMDRRVRSDRVLWLEPERDRSISFFFTRMGDLMRLLNQLCFLGLSGHEFHLAHYPRGTFYRRHIDRFRHRNNRQISVVVYLNPAWRPGDGGELVLYQAGGKKVVEPLFGRMVLFRSDRLEHEVMETHVDRLAITGWMLYQPPGLGFLG